MKVWHCALFGQGINLQSVKDLRPWPLFNISGDRILHGQRHEESQQQSRHDVPWCQLSNVSVPHLVEEPGRLWRSLKRQLSPAAGSSSRAAVSRRYRTLRQTMGWMRPWKVREFFCHARFRKHARSPQPLCPLTTLSGTSPS